MRELRIEEIERVSGGHNSPSHSLAGGLYTGSAAFAKGGSVGGAVGMYALAEFVQFFSHTLQ